MPLHQRPPAAAVSPDFSPRDRLLHLQVRRAMPGLPKHLVRRRLRLEVKALERLGQHRLVQLLQAEVRVRAVLLLAVDHLQRGGLGPRRHAP